MTILLLVLRVGLLLFTLAGILYSALFDNTLTSILYIAAAALALAGLFEPRASIAALACVLVAGTTSWLPGNPGH